MRDNIFKQSKAMVLNHPFHLFTVTGVATMTSKGSVLHILLVYNLLKHFYNERIKIQTS